MAPGVTTRCRLFFLMQLQARSEAQISREVREWFLYFLGTTTEWRRIRRSQMPSRNTSNTCSQMGTNTESRISSSPLDSLDLLSLTIYNMGAPLVRHSCCL